MLSRGLNYVLHQAVRIENQRYSPVAEDGGAGDHLDVSIKPAQALDHRLVISQHLVYDEAVVSVLGFHYHDLLALRPLRLHPKILAEPDVGNDLAAHVGDVIAIRVLDVLAGQLNAFQAVGQRQYEMCLAHPDQQPIDDRQRERQPERYGEARARPARDLDQSAQSVHATLNHVHAHTPPGNVGHLAGRRETRRQDEREDFSLGKLGLAVDQPLLNPPCTQHLHIQAAAVVTDPDQYVSAGVYRGKVNSTGGTLAGCPSGVWRLNAVIHAVADQVHQWIVQLIDHGLIQFRVSPLEIGRA